MKNYSTLSNAKRALKAIGEDVAQNPGLFITSDHNGFHLDDVHAKDIHAKCVAETAKTEAYRVENAQLIAQVKADHIANKQLVAATKAAATKVLRSKGNQTRVDNKEAKARFLRIAGDKVGAKKAAPVFLVVAKAKATKAKPIGKKAYAVADPKSIARLQAGRTLFQKLVGGEHGPVTVIRYVTAKTTILRRELLSLAAEFGINRHTANRQYQETRSGKVACPDLVLQ